MTVQGAAAIAGSATIMTALISLTIWYVRARDLQRILQPFGNDLRHQLNSSVVNVVPLRLFIGVGWIRASAEKLVDGDWWTGAKLSSFLAVHVDQGRIVFPAYQSMVREVFIPYAMVLAAVIVIGELLAGLAILTGTFTNAALLGGLFMNLNFLLVGEPDPGTFYIVIQIVLLVTGAGAVFGFDRRLSRSWTRSLVVAQPVAAAPASCHVYVIGLILAATAGIYSSMHVTDTSPAGSVRDPAMILVVLSSLAVIWLALKLARARVGRGSSLPASTSDRSPG
jgi:thiosulfate dehydrogenase [quinone] large subunit